MLTKHQRAIMNLLVANHIEVDWTGVWVCDKQRIKVKRVEQPTFNLLVWKGCLKETAIIRGVHHWTVA